MVKATKTKNLKKLFMCAALISTFSCGITTVTYAKDYTSIIQEEIMQNEANVRVNSLGNATTASVEFDNEMYIDYPIPEYDGFKTYMDWKCITAKSKQKDLQAVASTSEDGLRVVDGRYCIALGTFCKAKIGQYVDLTLENGTIIECIMAEVKADCDTDENGLFTSHSNCCSEFLIESDVLSSKVKKYGDVSKLYDTWDSPVDNIRVYAYCHELE